jgi:CheY-like chemotaxis protein
VRIIIATGYLEPELKARLFRAGVLDCIQKPYTMPDLLERLGAAIKIAARQSQ